ncbi:hypothetical protein [Halospeciosus flavus]|uniref:DNA-directed RNA polymerase subunit epsilon n=1 Tax=Halospeciosus flavus TaxID=3032283 RepID=A0ABD5Z2S7_9EURY|nr:hypothetical protein [Halospeciosus flavus]
MADGSTGTDAAPTIEWESEPRPELDVRPGSGTLPRTEARKNEHARRWGVVTPAATRIGSASTWDGGEDGFENLRRLHEERHPAMQGHSERMHRLDKAKITHALANQLQLTPWQRDRAVGVVRDLDLTAFGSQRAIEKVALVAIRYVVDEERKHYLGLDDQEWVESRSPAELQDLYERFTSIKDEAHFEELLDRHGLDKTSLNRLLRTLREQVEERGLDDAVLGHNPNRDPALPDVGQSWRTRDDAENDRE